MSFGWGGGAHPSWVFFCSILGFFCVLLSLLYPLCLCLLSLFLILLPLMMTFRVMSKILAIKETLCFSIALQHSILHIERKLVLTHALSNRVIVSTNRTTRGFQLTVQITSLLKCTRKWNPNG